MPREPRATKSKFLAPATQSTCTIRRRLRFCAKKLHRTFDRRGCKEERRAAALWQSIGVDCESKSHRFVQENDMDLKLTGKIALVTGSTAGIGFATAKSLANEGAQVYVNGRTQERVDAALAAIRSHSPKVNVDGILADF